MAVTSFAYHAVTNLRIRKSYFEKRYIPHLEEMSAYHMALNHDLEFEIPGMYDIIKT